MQCSSPQQRSALGRKPCGPMKKQSSVLVSTEFPHPFNAAWLSMTHHDSAVGLRSEFKPQFNSCVTKDDIGSRDMAHNRTLRRKRRQQHLKPEQSSNYSHLHAIASTARYNSKAQANQMIVPTEPNLPIQSLIRPLALNLPLLVLPLCLVPQPWPGANWCYVWFGQLYSV